jgi:hypothetical protein
LGCLVVSQNARQYNNSSGEGRKFSYTLYDALGRVIEAGEKTENFLLEQSKLSVTERVASLESVDGANESKAPRFRNLT